MKIIKRHELSLNLKTVIHTSDSKLHYITQQQYELYSTGVSGVKFSLVEIWYDSICMMANEQEHGLQKIIFLWN